MSNTNLNEEYNTYREYLEYVYDLLSNLLDSMDIEMGSKQEYYKNNREARLEIEKNLEQFENALEALDKIKQGFDEIKFDYYLLTLPEELKNKPEIDYRNVVKFPIKPIDDSVDIWVDESYDISHVFNTDNTEE